MAAVTALEAVVPRSLLRTKVRTCRISIYVQATIPSSHTFPC